MSRYIDADALIEVLKQRGIALSGTIADQPSIDIVLCKECKHNPWNVETDYTCVWDDDFADRPQTPDDFCSYGEREGE